MAKGVRGGFGMKRPNAGSGNNMQALLRQAQQMQASMEKDKEELAGKEVEGTSGGGAVTVVMSGDQSLKSLKIKPEVVDPDDVEMLEDLIVAAFNDAAAKCDALNEEAMGKYNASLGGLM
ncbi:MAG: YbaB/EbfC family nucleoid-associated protein [Ruminococcaceae bacterium]|nr:YbaB/EbfC family nucleoid-associated protein [Oscillospiraceae bacterium]